MESGRRRLVSRGLGECRLFFFIFFLILDGRERERGVRGIFASFLRPLFSRLFYPFTAIRGHANEYQCEEVINSRTFPSLVALPLPFADRRLGHHHGREADEERPRKPPRRGLRVRPGVGDDLGGVGPLEQVDAPGHGADRPRALHRPQPGDGEDRKSEVLHARGQSAGRDGEEGQPAEAKGDGGYPGQRGEVQGAAGGIVVVGRGRGGGGGARGHGERERESEGFSEQKKKADRSLSFFVSSILFVSFFLSHARAYRCCSGKHAPRKTEGERARQRKRKKRSTERRHA